MNELTQIIRAAIDGVKGAKEEALAQVYQELQKIAKSMLKLNQNISFETCELVHEAYFRLFPEAGDRVYENRKHFFAFAAKSMRSIIVDHVRAKQNQKALPKEKRVPLDGLVELYEKRALNLLELEEALNDLEQLDPSLVALVELRFFLGFSVKDISEIVDLSERSIHRKLETARAWLRKELNGG